MALRFRVDLALFFASAAALSRALDWTSRSFAAALALASRSRCALAAATDLGLGGPQLSLFGQPWPWRRRSRLQLRGGKRLGFGDRASLVLAELLRLGDGRSLGLGAGRCALATIRALSRA